jgi:diphosphoinositol-polyphosphate diphosphatase
VITISTPSTTLHFYEMDVVGLDHDWVESHQRRREWVDYAEAIRRLEWKAELAQALKSSSLAQNWRATTPIPQAPFTPARTPTAF